MKTHPKNRNLVFCERHKNYFFSRVWAEKGRKPKQCPVCKRYDYEVVKDG